MPNCKIYRSALFNSQDTQDTFSSIRELSPNNSESFLSYLCVTADNGEDNEWRKCPNNLQKDRNTEEDI